MTLFLLTGIPLTFLCVLYLLYPEEVFSKEVRIAFWRGCLFFIPTAVIAFFFRSLVPFSFLGSQLWLYTVVHDYGLYLLLAVSGYLLFYHTEEGSGHTLRCAAYLSGFFLFSGVLDYLYYFSRLNGYYLFFVPLFRISLIYGLAALMPFIRKFKRLFILLFIGAAILFAMAAASPIILYWRRYHFFFYLAAGVISLLGLGSFMACYLVSRPRGNA